MRSGMIGLLVGGVLMTAPQTARAGSALQLRTGTVETVRAQAVAAEYMPQWLNSGYALGSSLDTEIPNSQTLSARFFVVQFKSKITPVDQSLLQRLGAKSKRYLPDDAYLIDASSLIAEELKAHPSVQAVFPYKADWKVSSDFAPSSLFSNEANPVVIHALDETLALKIARAIENLGAKIEAIGGRALVTRLNRSQIETAAQLEGVEWIQPAPEMKILNPDFVSAESLAESSEDDLLLAEPPEDDNPSFPPRVPTEPVPMPTPDESAVNAVPPRAYNTLTGYESGTKLMNFSSAWRRGYQGLGQTIAVADTGFDSGVAATLHSDFGRRLSGQVFGMFSKSWSDPAGHGTHVAGLIIGSGLKSRGALRGGAPKAKLIGQSMWSPILSSLVVPQKLSELFGQAYEAGARIHSNSWGSIRNLGTYDMYAVQVDEFAFENPDFLIVFAAGNNGSDRDKDGRVDGGTITPPATAKNTLTVGASENLVKEGGIQTKLIRVKGGLQNWPVEPLASDTLSDNPGGLAGFSSRGPTVDGRIKPDVVAPGTNILSTRSHIGKHALWGAFNDEYIWSGGTSMATPLVAGAAGVVREYLIRSKRFANPSAALIKNVIMHTAVDLFPGQFGEIGEGHGQEILTKRPTPDEGWGRVDVSRATSLTTAKIIDEKTGVALGQSKSYRFKLNNARKITASLVWTDAAASPNAARVLVNDLDLVLTTADGKKVRARDRVNNTELIFTDIAAGIHTISVVGENIPQGIRGKQPYSLLITVE